MKTALNFTSSSRSSGFATLTIMIILAVMALLIASNMKTLSWLHREINLVDHHQVIRWQSTATNQPPTTP